MDSRVERFFRNMKGKRVAFCGMGRSNTPLITQFLEAGAQVIACDRDIKNKLADTEKRLTDQGVICRRGEDYLKNLEADILFRTPGMNFYTDELNDFRQKGVTVTSEMEVFFDLCPATLISVTGSDGKTTTTTLIAKLLEAAGKIVHLGGNIGRALLPEIKEIEPHHFAVVELSSFQLISMRKSPDIAVVTNVTPNHLDMHKDMDEYVDAKRNIYRHQSAFSKTVLNPDNDITLSFAKETRGDTQFFSRRHVVSVGAYMDEQGDLYYKGHDGKAVFLLNRRDILLPGMHNVENYLAAITAVWEFVTPEQIRQVASTFVGVEHRMELVRTLDGVRYYNDSIATTPTRTISGTLSLFENKIILLAGGYDKNIPFDQLGPVLCDKVKTLILTGATAPKIKQCVLNSENYTEGCPVVIEVDSLAEAVAQAKACAQSGDIVSLSPACASFDSYDDFEQRGNHFKDLVNQL